MTYAAVTDWMNKDERERFDRQLVAKDPSQVSHGTQALLGLMGGPGAQRSAPPRPGPQPPRRAR